MVEMIHTQFSIRWKASLRDADSRWTLRTFGGSAAGTFAGPSPTSETTRVVDC